MKRNRFSEMVPPTPEDFHTSVLDALNHLPVRRRRRASSGALRIAASVAVVLAVGALLALAIRLRPSPEDRVASPSEELLPTVAPELSDAAEASGLHLEIGEWRVDASGVGVDWSIEGPSDETLLVYAGAELNPTQDFVDLMEVYYALLGQDVLGVGNGAKLERSDWMSWDDSPGPDHVEVTARIYVYRPTAEFIDARDQRPESFEGVSKWLIAPMDSYMAVMPIDYYGRYEYQTPFGCDRMDAVQSAINGEFFNFENSVPLSMADKVELERILLESLDFAELVKGWEVTIDMHTGSGSGATEIREIAP